MLALTAETAKTYAIGFILGLLVVGWFVFKYIRVVTTKAVLLIVLAGSLLGVWSQRSDVADCAAKVRANLLAKTACDFFGFKVEVGLKK